MKHVQVGDLSVRVLDGGKQGPPLLFVHGFPLTHTMWQPQIEFFVHRSRIIAPDLRGFGETNAGSHPPSMEQMADDLNGLLDALQITDRIVFCGLSMGGYIGWEFWRKYGHRLAGLIQCDTRAIADTPEVAKGRRILANKVLSEGPKAAIESMMPKLFSPQTPVQQAHLVELIRQMIESNSPTSIAAALEGLATRRDARELLPKIDVPTLIIVGEHDAISTATEMRQIADAIPQTEFVVIPQAGHLAPLENPTLVNEAIARFLECSMPTNI